MKDSIGLRIFLFILVTTTISIFTYMLSFISMVLGGGNFYIPFFILFAIGILCFIFNGFFPFVQGKRLRKYVISFFTIAVISVVINEGINAYVRGIPTMNTDLDLYDYQPFKNGTKAVTLDEPSFFQIEGDLPIIDGATAIYPVYAAFAQATYPEKDYDVYDSEIMSNRTPYAYENIIYQDADIIFALAPSAEQIEQALNSGVNLILTPIGMEAFVFFVNSKNRIDNLALEEIKGIYSGEVKNWKELGGENDSIRAFQRPNNSGSQTALQLLMGDTAIMNPPKEDIVSLMGGIIEETADYKNFKNAIGYSFRNFSMEMVQNKSIRHLAIDDVYPTIETIKSGEYPITYQIYAVTAGSTNPNIQPFKEWILSTQGQTIVEKTGYAPIHEEEEHALYSILTDKIYRVLLEEEYVLPSQEIDAPTLRRKYLILNGKQGESYTYSEMVVLKSQIKDFNDAKNYLAATNPKALRLLPNTIVDESVLLKWQKEGYNPEQEYWEESPKGLTMEDI